MVFLGKKNQLCLLLLTFSYSLFSVNLFCEAADQISKGQQLNDGEFLTSSDDVFELGFFSPSDTSGSRFLGIRYHSIEDKAIIWIANRNNPISSTNGSMTIGEDGNLIVRDGNGVKVWSSNSTKIVSNNTVAVLETTGNFILYSNENIGDIDGAYWQSFNEPSDTFLPNMKVLASSSEEIRVFTSWKSETDPSPGNFTMGVDPRAAPQIVIWNQTRRIWRSGHWNGIFTGIPSMAALTNYRYGFKVTTDQDGQTYITYNPSVSSDLLRFVISWDGYEEQLRWNESEKGWDMLQRQPATDCEKYNYCGDFGICSETDSPKCNCLDGFEPKNQEQWRRGNWSEGCKRRASLQCQRNDSVAEDGFKLLRCMKLPDFADTHGVGINFEDCEKRCLQDCSCNAFAVITNIGCMTWSDELIDLRSFEKAGSSLYLRLADSELDDGGLSTYVIVIIVIACVVFVAISGWLVWKLKRKLKVLPAAPSIQLFGKSEAPLSDVSKGKEYSTDHSAPADFSVDSTEVNAPDLPMFNFNVVAAATDNFSEENKLGQGGFGPVYKGKLPGGEEIAVKRLSKVSGQGLEEFKNEIILIAKLQHRNLVRLLGCCIQGEEKILLYEYMPNKSLDCFIFDSAMQPLLDWRKRFTIIEGIARGLLYLHRDSRLRIIHRDLKASNILLDEDMIPKISDFGMAKIFGGNQNEANTTRVVGTYGYMSPEYAMEGLFSVKSDVYSFGVLVLEIVSGRRNTSFRLSDHVNLINYAWQLWNDGRAMELVNPSFRNSCSEEEVLKCIQVGMLCVQDSALHRPTMQAVVLMLESNSPTLPLPRQPTFTSMRASIDTKIYVDRPEITAIPESDVERGLSLKEV